jgi:pimeloyl-ACP methyl ester carboxylesterase
MTTAPIVLVPGFWLGAWAWDDVVAALGADGHDVTAITLPGLESADADRAAITLSDHIEAIYRAVTAKGTSVVLAVHSGAGVPGYAASDRVPDQLAAMVYVDSGPAIGALDPDFDAIAALREAPPRLADERRLDVASAVVCSSMSSDQIKTAVEEGYPWVGGLVELRDVTYIDLPTGHWPMWSRSQELAVILADVARRSSS